MLLDTFNCRHVNVHSMAIRGAKRIYGSFKLLHLQLIQRILNDWNMDTLAAVNLDSTGLPLNIWNVQLL